jgi:hypothetical protein
MSAGVQAQSSTLLRLLRTWFSTWSHLFTAWASMAPGLFLNFLPTFLIFHGVVLEFLSRKLTTFRVFPEGKL